MIIGILKEPKIESRVSLLPAEVNVLIKSGNVVWVETDAGSKSFSSDNDYLTNGAEIKSRMEILEGAEMLLGINYAGIPENVENKFFVGVYQPLFNPENVQTWINQHLTVFSLDMLPRSTRAQSMDVLSSQSNIAGYKAALLAASMYPRYFPMMMTAAGSVAPAKVLILGAGVAGLQAVATSRRLGAVVEVFDTRADAKQEVLSLGAKFIEVEGAADASKAGGYAVDQSDDFRQKQKQKIADSIKKADVVITTAQIFGKKAPVLITEEMIGTMRSGSLIIDLASSTGGNTELTEDNKTLVYNNVTIIGNSNLAASAPADASKLYGKNILSFLKLVINKEGKPELNLGDDIINSACITANGKINSPIYISKSNYGHPIELLSLQS